MFLEGESPTLRLCIHITQGISQEGKNLCVLHELGNKMQLGVWGHCEPLNGFRDGPRGKAFGKCTIFSFKLVWYSLLEIVKLKLTVSIV